MFRLGLSTDPTTQRTRVVYSLGLDSFDYGETIASMATLQEMKIANKKMEAAEAALRDYVNRPPNVDADPIVHQRLSECLQHAKDDLEEVLKSGYQ